LILKYIIDAIEMNEVDAIITTGGTGYSPTDYTSETVRKILDREIKGFADVFRFISYQQIGSASFMSDVIAGVISSKPIFCLPGSPRAVEIGVKMILEEIGHLLFILKGSKMKEELPPEAYDFVDFLNTPLPKDNIIVEILDSIGKVRAYIELTYESTNSASLKSFLTYLDVNLYRIESSIIGKLNIDSVKTPNGKVEIDNKISKALLSIIYYYLRDLERK